MIKKVLISDKMGISLSEAKEHLRVLNDEDDVYILSLIEAVSVDIESKIGTALKSQTFDVYFISEKIALSKMVTNIISCNKILDNDFVGEVAFKVDFIAQPPKFEILEDSDIGEFDYLVLRWEEGFIEVPSDLKQYIKIKVSNLYENRESVVVGASISNFNSDFIENIIEKYKNVEVKV